MIRDNRTQSSGWRGYTTSIVTEDAQVSAGPETATTFSYFLICAVVYPTD